MKIWGGVMVIFWVDRRVVLFLIIIGFLWYVYVVFRFDLLCCCLMNKYVFFFFFVIFIILMKNIICNRFV